MHANAITVNVLNHKLTLAKKSEIHGYCGLFKNTDDIVPLNHAVQKMITFKTYIFIFIAITYLTTYLCLYHMCNNMVT